MYNYSMLPASHAEVIMKPLIIEKTINFTFIDSIDESELYEELDKRLLNLEVALIAESEALQSIIDDAKGFRLLQDEKDEILMRIDWLQNLYKIQQNLSDVQTKEEAEENKRLLSRCQTSPLKNHLLTKLAEFALSLPSEQVEDVQTTDAEVLMEKAIEEAGDSFINLGAAGRNSVIADVLNQSSKKATIEAVQEHTKTLEQLVEKLTSLTNSGESIKQLERLPLPVFHGLSADRKTRIGENLIKNNNWNGLASLDRMIAHLDKAITNEEQQITEAENAVDASDGKAALTLTIKNVVDGKIQVK